MSKHTPEPWEEDDGNIYGGGGAIYVCSMRGYEGTESDEWLARLEADTRLVIAAPAGLRAAESAYLALLRAPPTSQLRLQSQYVLTQLRDFIAEVRGLDSEVIQTAFERSAAIHGELA